jgi:tripartite-type tricarboxylate transporter receptor subunit TctC
MIKKLFTIILFGLAVLTANAEIYKIYNGTPAGSLSDSQTRKLALFLEQKTGDTFVVINRPGADQLVAYQSFIEESRNNPNVIYYSGTGTHVASYILYPNLKLDPLKDTKSLFYLLDTHYYICTPKDSPIRGIQDIKGKLNIGSSNATTTLILEQLNLDPEIQIIPYKDDKTVFLNLLSGDLPAAMCVSMNPLIRVNKDKIKIVANFDKFLVGGVGFHVPANMPDTKTKELNRLLNQAIKDPEINQFFTDNYGIPVGGPPEVYDRVIEQYQRSLLSKLIKK